MKFKKLLLTAVISGCIAVAPVQAHAAGATLTAAAIIKAAKKKLIFKGASFLASALFGSGKPDYVNLSEESLREIQRRVRAEIIRDAEFDFLSQFRALEDLVESYHAHVNHTGNPNLAMQLDLLGRYKDAVNHRALNSSNNQDFFYMADTYALLASVSVAIQTERFLSNQIPESEVTRTATNFANTLEDMLRRKRAADLPLRDDCEMISSPYDQYEEWDCWVKDANGYYVTSMSIDGDSRRDWDEWDLEMEQAIDQYMEENFRRLEAVVRELRSV